MKKIFGLLVLILLSMNIVLAGETYKIDFSKQGENLVGLKEGDRVEFSLKGERSTIILTKIRENSAEIKAYIALDKRNVPYYSDLKKDNRFVFDVDDDGIKDMEVKLYKIERSLATLYFNKLEGSLWPVGNVVLDTNNERGVRANRVYDLILVGFFVLIGMIMVIFILKRYKSKKLENKEENEEEKLDENFIY